METCCQVRTGFPGPLARVAEPGRARGAPARLARAGGPGCPHPVQPVPWPVGQDRLACASGPGAAGAGLRPAPTCNLFEAYGIISYRFGLLGLQ